MRYSVAEALARGVVEAVRHGFDFMRGEAGDVDLARQAAAQPAVGVLDGALLPRRLRLAEEAVDAELVLEARAGGEAAPVEDDLGRDRPLPYIRRFALSGASTSAQRLSSSSIVAAVAAQDRVCS